jgi:CoA transferase family III
MRISAPDLPFIDWLVKDTGRGKLSAYADIATRDGRAALQRLVEDADILLQAFRPGALAARGFGFSDVAARRPGIVYGSLSAYGDAGPWASRRGFDSRWCRRQPASTTPRRRLPALKGRRSCHARRLIMRRDTCWRSARSWPASAKRARAAAGWCACRWRRLDDGCGTWALSKTVLLVRFRHSMT